MPQSRRRALLQEMVEMIWVPAFARFRSAANQLLGGSFGPAVILLLAFGIGWVVLLLVGPMSVVAAMPDIDLGSGISMTADGQIKVTNDSAAGPMRIPEESEYNGITMP